MKIMKLSGHVFIIVCLTILTQIGGVIWLVSLIISKSLHWKKRYLFTSLYLVFNILIIPPIASYFGREPLPILSNNLKPRNWFYPLAFRNYVTPELKQILINVTTEDGISITYLDANFPFYNGFPLLPHLSHNDGKKVDLSFMYLDEFGKTTDKKPSVSGYGTYVDASNLTATNCVNKGYWQYDFTKYLTFGTINKLVFDTKRSKHLVKSILAQKNVDKIFIEPYLKKSLGLTNKSKIRFHGCQAVRHDDHIHLQVY